MRRFLVIFVVLFLGLNSTSFLSGSYKKKETNVFSLKKIIKVTFLSFVSFSEKKECHALKQKKWLRRSLNIFGNDDRFIPEELTYPSMAVGKITFDSPDGMIYSCTGSLIARDYLLTNGHCVFTSIEDENEESVYRYLSDEWKQTFSFKIAFSNGVEFDSSSWELIIFPKSYSKMEQGDFSEDWVIIKLSKNLGDSFGWLGLSSRSYDEYSDDYEPVHLIGYSGDHYLQSPGADYECGLYGVSWVGSNQQILHDCDSTKGSSGAGIFIYQNESATNNEDLFPYIVAIHHAEMIVENETNPVKYSKSTSNLACETSEAHKAFSWALKNYPSSLNEYTNKKVKTIGLKPELPEVENNFEFESKFGLIINSANGSYINLQDFEYVIIGAAGGVFSMLVLLVSSKYFSKEKCIKERRKLRKKTSMERVYNNEVKVKMSELLEM